MTTTAPTTGPVAGTTDTTDRKVFYHCTVNGIIGVCSAGTYANTHLLDLIDPGPIFTFVSKRRLKNEPWHTGDIDLLGRLTAHAVDMVEVDDLPVPFADVVRPRDVVASLDSVGTLANVIAVFGLRFASDTQEADAGSAEPAEEPTA